MMESALIFLTSLITLQTNLRLSEQVQHSSAGFASLGTQPRGLRGSIRIGCRRKRDPDPGGQTKADPDPGGRTKADPDPDSDQTLSHKKLDFDMKNIGTLFRKYVKKHTYRCVDTKAI
jgi:hypothetical protein